MKNIIVIALFSLFAIQIAQAAFEREDNELGLKGLYEVNGLPEPSTVADCADDVTHVQIFNFVGKFLHELSGAGLGDINRIKNEVNEFSQQLPQSFKDCIANNQEVVEFANKYGLNDKSDPAAIEKTAISFITLHYFKVKGWVKQADKDWNGAKYEITGEEGAQWLHEILGNGNGMLGGTFTRIPERLNNQLGLKGLYQKNSLPEPQTVADCADDATHVQIFNFVGKFLHELSNAGLGDITRVQNEVDEFSKDCIAQNQEVVALGKKYGLDETSVPSAIEKKAISFITLHYFTVKGWVKQADKDWNGAKYEVTGEEGAQWLHQILGNGNGMLGGTFTKIPERINNQLGLKGLYQKNSLPEPQTVAECADDATHVLIFNSVSNLLRELDGAGLGDINKIRNEVVSFKNQLPQSLKDCLANNKEVAAFKKAYGLTDTTDASYIEKKMISFTTLHFTQVKAWIKQADQDWNGAKYETTGQEVAQELHQVLGNGVVQGFLAIE